MAVNDVVLAAVTEAVVPLNFTILWVVTLEKFVPVMVTVVPTGPHMGATDVIVGVNRNVKSTSEVASWSATETVILPVVAPGGTVVLICVAVEAVTVAVTLLNLTILFAGVVLKLVPVMVIVVPAGAVTGVNNEIVGGKSTVKSVAETEVTSLTNTEIFPVVAPCGTTATMLVGVADVTVAITLLNFTVFWEAVALKLVPVIVIEAPTPAATGVKEVMVEGNNTAKSLAEVACPLDVVTAIFPEVAPAGTDTVSVVLVAEVAVVRVPLKVTTLFPGFSEKFSPVM